jgi:ABC-type uncharacterized transport system permease subunit
MIWRALAVWLVILVLANLNGAVRELWIIPQIGELSGRALSTLILCGLVFFLTWRTIGWIRPVSAGEAVEIGVLWLLLTLAFEFLVGHYVFGTEWATLLEDYDVTKGRIWPLVLAFVVVSPMWTGRMRGLF